MVAESALNRKNGEVAEFHGGMAPQPEGRWARNLAERLMSARQTRRRRAGGENVWRCPDAYPRHHLRVKMTLTPVHKRLSRRGCSRLPFDTAQRLIESWRLPLGSMRTDLSVEEAGAVVDPPKRRETVLGRWCEANGGIKPKTPTVHLHVMVSNAWRTPWGAK